jgi:hypothetical protein
MKKKVPAFSLNRGPETSVEQILEYGKVYIFVKCFDKLLGRNPEEPG